MLKVDFALVDSLLHSLSLHKIYVSINMLRKKHKSLAVLLSSGR